MSVEYFGHNGIGKHFFKPKTPEELKSVATIVIDTNVLLSAYQWKEVTVREVKETLEKLAVEKRLKIPSHVVKEFMDQRPKRIVETNQKIENSLLSKFQKLPKLSSTVPFLEMLPNSSEYLEAEKMYNQSFDKYKKYIQEIIAEVKGFINSDPVLDNFEQLIIDCYYQLEPEEIAGIQEEAKERLKGKIPPLTGGDSGKKENFEGDYIIWKHILKLDTDVIFVTSDNKEDWVINDHHDNFLSPRRELIEEFYLRSEGKTFTILSPKDFVELFNSQIGSDIAEDLNKSIKEESELFGYLRELFKFYDPLGIAHVDENEYDIEIKYIMNNMPIVTSIASIEELMLKTLEKYFGKSETDANIALKMARDLFNYLILGTTYPRGPKKRL